MIWDCFVMEDYIYGHTCVFVSASSNIMQSYYNSHIKGYAHSVLLLYMKIINNQKLVRRISIISK